MENTEHCKAFLENDVMNVLTNLKVDTPANFGLMTAQHMVEHLIWVTKMELKRYGEPAAEPTEGQLKFKKFIAKGARFRYFPTKKTVADLPKLKYASLEEAISNVPATIERFYAHFAANPDFKCYNPFQGELDFKELELLTYMHFRYHLDQFGLMEKGW